VLTLHETAGKLILVVYKQEVFLPLQNRPLVLSRFLLAQSVRAVTQVPLQDA